MNLSDKLPKYGVPESSIQYLQDHSPNLLDYLDLIERRGEAELLPDCVIEKQNQPLLFVINESQLAHTPPDHQYQPIRHALPCRGQRAYLARLRPGELCVIPVDTTKKPQWKTYREDSSEALSFFSRLALGHYDGQEQSNRGDYVFKQMLALLDQVAEELVSQGLAKSDVVSLTGRALFFRFLCDRKIITESDVKSIAPNATSLEDCFDGIENAAATCQWLDKTFNGDFLSLTGRGNQAFFETIGQRSKNKVFDDLSAIARAYEAVGAGNYQLLFRFEHWTDFDFAHIPVGLLSQVHEKFAKKWDKYAGSTSVHYTPRNIAATLVEEVFDGLPDAHNCSVLDPACGAGVFLVLAFRRLYRQRWQATETRPDTRTIREILMRQLVGFDISDSALKLAALSLYLTAIELDPEPIPPDKLKFENLRDKVLFNFRQEEDAIEGPVAGSLNPAINGKFDGKFDIVLSNPPWTSLQEKYKELAGDLNKISKDIIARRGDAETAQKYQNPDSAPDLPFLWKATEWCKPGGRIAMALPARILLKQEEVPSFARETLFRLLEVNGIINGSNLADTSVWPDMNQPFMLLLASNRKPRKGHTLHFITPHYDDALNDRGEMWIDSKSAVPVEAEATFEEPWLWKALAVGTALDIEVVRKIKAIKGRPLQQYWEKDLGLVSRNGYQIKATQPEQQDARFLQVLPDLNSTQQFPFLVDTSELPLFSRDQACWTRRSSSGDELKVYRAPLILIKESPGVDRHRGRALLSFDDLAYNESYHGYSANGHPEADLLTRYIQLFVHSDIWMHYALMTSPKFGAERRRIYKSDLDECPIIPIEELNAAQKKEIKHLSERLLEADMRVFEEIDNFFANLYGLDALDLEVIQDTLDVGLPYKAMRQRACMEPTLEECDKFRLRLRDLICPFFNIVEQEPCLVFWQPSTNQQFTSYHDSASEKISYWLLHLSVQSEHIPVPDESVWLKILQIALKHGATRVFHEYEGSLLLAILNQYRYWTPTRARLCAAEIARQYISVFEE